MTWQSETCHKSYQEYRKGVSSVIGALLLTDPVVGAVKKELRKLAEGIRIEDSEIAASIRDNVLRRDLVDGDEATSTTAKVAQLYKNVSAKKDPPKSKATPATKEVASPVMSVTDSLLAEAEAGNTPPAAPVESVEN